MDYMMNLSIGNTGVLQWGGSNGVGPNSYAKNPGHHRNNTAVVPRQRNKEHQSCYCENSKSLLLRMVDEYRTLHPVAAITVCALGILANALNVAVLTRPHLAPAPVNRILTAIAAADAALMAEYAAYAIFVRLPQAKSGE
ncbi:uncharacterized protein [Hetaerina americana]|uniref:uncharacterized protein n=1 Tax=Hetaerina americana TaxID=62018 RepID=UPI003A7F1BD9